MKFTQSKSTKRFNFGINRNPTSHQRGSNVVTIGTRQVDSSDYYPSASSITMTVKEAKALQSFLNNYFDESNQIGY